MPHNSSGCHTPFAYVLFAVIALHGISLEVPNGTSAGRTLRILTYSAPLTVLIASSFIPWLWNKWKESQLIDQRRQNDVEREQRRLAEKEDLEQKRIFDDEQKEIERRHQIDVAKLQQQQADKLAANEQRRREEKENKEWELKLARLECERQYEVFRHLMRSDFTESRFQKLMSSHLGEDCPQNQIQINKNEVLQLITLLVGEADVTTITEVKYRDAPSAIEYFETEVQKIENMDRLNDDDKEMLVALIKKRRVTVLDKLINYDPDNS
jgi:CRISPR/Cas system CSM-associated protein Csm2 small subunit